MRLVVALCVCLSSPAVLLGERPTGHDLHLRVLSRSIETLLDISMQRSAIIRSLVDRLNDSDVFVYLDFDSSARLNIVGRTTFMTKTAGRRYIRVGISGAQTRDLQIAVLGHELQHAVEIADAYEVVDVATLKAFYKRSGFERGCGTTSCFDSDRAIDTGRRVWREITATASRPQPRARPSDAADR